MEVGIPELLIILVIIVLLWGPGRLSKIGGELGSGIKAFRTGLAGDDEKKETALKPAEHLPEPVAEIANVEETTEEQNTLR